MNQNGNKNQEVAHRWKLALIITILSIVGISVVAGLVIGFAGENKFEASQNVLTAVLPLLAAWVSTVLAYYYSSESIEAATKSVKELLPSEEKLKTILVKDKMRKIHEMEFFTYTEELKVKEMIDKLLTSGKGSRLPFLNDKQQPEFILHKSAVDATLVMLSQSGIDISNVTLKDLFEKDPELKNLAEGSFGVVAEDATLADAKTEMQRIKGAQDVFVTTNGRKDGTVIGWITNNIIEKSSQVG